MAFIILSFMLIIFSGVFFTAFFSGGNLLDSFLGLFPLLVILLVAGIVNFWLFLRTDEDERSIFKWILLVVLSPIMILGILFWRIAKIFRVKPGKNKGKYYITSFAALLWEALCIALIVTNGWDGFFEALWYGGIIALLLMWSLGFFIVHCFMDVENKGGLEYLLLIINLPTLIFALIITLISGGLFEGIKKMPTRNDEKEAEKKYKLKMDSTGHWDVYDESGYRRITGLDWISDEGVIHGIDGSVYTEDKKQ